MWLHFYQSAFLSMPHIWNLKVSGFMNVILKYVYDNTLLVPELCAITIEEELENIKKWKYSKMVHC